MYKKIIILLFLTLSISGADGQQKLLKRVIPEPEWYAVGVRSGFGFIVPHRASMLHLITGHVFSTEIYIEKCNLEKKWQQLYSAPTYGFSFYYCYLANRDVLGNALALDYYTNLHLIRKPRFLFDLRLATGIGYLSKNFDPEYNNQNIAIGSKVNISIGASFDFKYELSRKWQIGAGISLKHFSNGSFTTPNLGINIPVLMLTAKKRLGLSFREHFTIAKEHISTEEVQKGFGYLLMLGYGAREIPPPGGKKMGVYSIQLGVRYQKHPKYAFLAGADVIHNVALYQHSIRYDSTFTGTQKDITQFALGIGYAQVFDHFELYLLNAFYLYSVSKKDGPVYQRIAGRYYFKKNFAVQFALKTHFAKADYFEVGLGYIFRQKKKKENESI